jgi:hypothetical protein
MAWDYIDAEKFKTLIKQIGGTITENDGDLVPFHVIKGSGTLWCYQPTLKSMIRVLRSSKIYVLDLGNDNDEDCLALSAEGNVFIISKDEIEEIGFN